MAGRLGELALMAGSIGCVAIIYQQFGRDAMVAAAASAWMASLYETTRAARLKGED